MLISIEEERCMVLSALECPALSANLRWSCRGGGVQLLCLPQVKGGWSERGSIRGSIRLD